MGSISLFDSLQLRRAILAACFTTMWVPNMTMDKKGKGNNGMKLLSLFSKPKQEIEPEQPLPSYDIIPSPHGFWCLRKRSFYIGIRVVGFCSVPTLNQYMEKVAIYGSIEEAEKDAEHLGLKQ